jgi:hypothetical protein
VSAKHTPGPWVVRRNGITGYPAAIEAINACNKTRGKVGPSVTRWNAITLPSSEEGQANANLIAAAPELLEALLEAEAGLEFAGADKEPEGQFVPAPTLALRIVRAAIAKAKGEAQ